MIKKDILIVIEDEELRTYDLDKKDMWEVGRTSKSGEPDIAFSSKIVSRKHGYFKKTDGIWFYMDYYGKNGTVYNNRKLNPGLGGMAKPICLEDRDVFVFGGGKITNRGMSRNVAIFSELDAGAEWMSFSNEKHCKEIRLKDGENNRTYSDIRAGDLIRTNNGMLIWFSDIIFATRNIAVSL